MCTQMLSYINHLDDSVRINIITPVRVERDDTSVKINSDNNVLTKRRGTLKTSTNL